MMKKSKGSEQQIIGLLREVESVRRHTINEKSPTVIWMHRNYRTTVVVLTITVNNTVAFARTICTTGNFDAVQGIAESCDYTEAVAE